MKSQTDRIEKTVLLHAPLSRVWRALSNANEFGAWFGVSFQVPFTEGARLVGRVVPTTVDPEVAKAQKDLEGAAFEITIDRVEPERLLSFRWHPFAIDPSVDYSREPTTLVTFVLEAVPGGTLLHLTESGFDGIPLERRASAFSKTEQGWTAQMALIQKYLGRPE